MTQAVLLRGGRVVDPKHGRDGVFDVLIEDARITRIDTDLPVEAVQVVDVPSDLVICPGLIDMHVHLREPGQEHKETVASGSAAAVAGGFTGVACMPNTEPVNDHAGVTEMILRKANDAGLARVYPIGAVSVGSQGNQLAEIGELQAAGCVGISDDGHPVADALMMRRALEYSSMFDMPVINHCEDPSLKGDGCAHEGYFASVLGLRGIPGASESVMVERDVTLSELTGGRVHIAHMSVRGSLRAIRSGKERGIGVTCEVTPHHFILTDEDLSYDTDTKMNPPLRETADRDAMLDGLVDGSIDVIATDHAPHHFDEKAVEFDKAPFGIIGLETRDPACARPSGASWQGVSAAGRRVDGGEPSTHPRSRSRRADRRRPRGHHRDCAGRHNGNRRSEVPVERTKYTLRWLDAERVRSGNDRGWANRLCERPGLGCRHLWQRGDLLIQGPRTFMSQPPSKDPSGSSRTSARYDGVRTKALPGTAALSSAYGRWSFRLRQRIPRPGLSQPSPTISGTVAHLASRPRSHRAPASALVERTEVVAGPVTGGALLAHTVAGLLDARRSLSHPPCRFAPFTADPTCGLALRRTYSGTVAGKRVLLADDVRNTGKTFERCAALVVEAGGEVIGSVQIHDRLESIVDLGVPNIALAEYKAPPNEAAADCPQCVAGIPITSF